MAGKPLPVRILMERTFNTALMVLEEIDGIPFTKLTMDVYFFCKDVAFKEVVRLYDAQLELAGANQEKFVFGLHGFYNNVVSKVKKAGKQREFAEFLGTVSRIQKEKCGQFSKHIIDAYLDLILQTFEYLRPNKFAMTECVYGVSTGGEFLTGPYPYPFSDLPVMEFEEKMETGWRPKSREDLLQFLSRLYAKYGIELHSEDELDVLEMIQRIHITTTAALLPLINEYTFQIIPEKVYTSIKAPLQDMRIHADPERLKEKLKHRRRTLPTNGVLFEVDDPIGELQGVFLQETLYADSIHCLYRIDTRDGSLAGYYDTSSTFFFSISQDADDPLPYQSMTAFVLALYASQVLDTEPLTADLFQQAGKPLPVRVFQKGGKLRDTYHRGPAKDRDPDLYGHKEKAIAGFVRKLPEGAIASDDAKRVAEQYGFELAADETYVRPFIKQVFVRKNQREGELKHEQN